jgi:hypothetical protein
MSFFFVLYLELLIIRNLFGDWGLGIGDWGLGIGPNPQFEPNFPRPRNCYAL